MRTQTSVILTSLILVTFAVNSKGAGHLSTGALENTSAEKIAAVQVGQEGDKRPQTGSGRQLFSQLKPSTEVDKEPKDDNPEHRGSGRKEFFQSAQAIEMQIIAAKNNHGNLLETTSKVNNPNSDSNIG